jgi:hypothetical protein
MAVAGIWASHGLANDASICTLHPACQTDGAPKIAYKKTPERAAAFQEHFAHVLQDTLTEVQASSS